ncbi:hypothetical protein KYT87_09325 [Achromobacter sp. ES-001]|uniref:hypothetical protein n=1 Tax=Achromobacter sp. ES-001 TaxID=2860286 RepID=UPI001C63FD7A|nr:hypothetical protein [Achromobacter sp. ES-001]QYJ23394.1 hypothetical protein KYT87_09325 [Achromobacter sp. ES-001]
MESKDSPQYDEDPVVNLVMSVGLPGFVFGFSVVIFTILFICRRAVEFFFPGA